MTERATEKDGPWAVVIALASFLSQGLLGGYVYTAGMFYTIFTDQFPDVSPVAVSWLCTLPLTLWYIGSLLGSVITNRFGNRACALFGGSLAAIGLSLCYFATNFYLVFLFYGIVTGSGYGIQYVGFVNAVSQYFDKYRTVVTILTTIGPTAGMAIFSFLLPNLIHHYTWTGALLVLGGISLNLWTCAFVLFPIPTQQQRKRSLKLSILKKKYFLCACFQCYFMSLSIALIILHLPSLILSQHHGPTNVSLALTTYGVINCFAKLFYSVLGHLCNADVCVVYSISLLLCGIAMTLVPVLAALQWILTLVGLVGFTVCVSGGHSLMVVLVLAGQDFFADAVGISQVFKAAGTLSAGPIAGFLYSYSRSYKMSFYCGGIAMVCGSILMIPILVNTWKSKRQEIYGRKYSVTITYNEECLSTSLVAVDS